VRRVVAFIRRALYLGEQRLTDFSNLKGCQKVAGGRSPRRPPEKVIHDRTPKGCQTVNLERRIWHPSGVRPNSSLAFPVVSADSDHRLLSLQPFGLLRSVNYIVTLAKPRPGLNSVRWSAAGLDHCNCHESRLFFRRFFFWLVV